VASHLGRSFSVDYCMWSVCPLGDAGIWLPWLLLASHLGRSFSVDYDMWSVCPLGDAGIWLPWLWLVTRNCPEGNWLPLLVASHLGRSFSSGICVNSCVTPCVCVTPGRGVCDNVPCVFSLPCCFIRHRWSLPFAQAQSCITATVAHYCKQQH